MSNETNTPLTAEEILEKNSDVKVQEILNSDFPQIRNAPLITVGQAINAMTEFKNPHPTAIDKEAIKKEFESRLYITQSMECGNPTTEEVWNFFAPYLSFPPLNDEIESRKGLKNHYDLELKEINEEMAKMESELSAIKEQNEELKNQVLTHEERRIFNHDTFENQQAEITSLKQQLEGKEGEWISVEEVIKIISRHVGLNCEDHTPYRGACLDCGQHNNYELIKYPENLISYFKNLLPSPPNT